MKDIVSILNKTGPARSSKIVKILQAMSGMSAENARQKVSRAGGTIKKFPYGLLPNREGFVYLIEQRTSEGFWLKYLKAMRETNSVYGFAIDSLIARGGIIKISEFAVFSGAPIAMRGQVASQRVARTLESSGVIQKQEVNGEECYVLKRSELGIADFFGHKPRTITENIILDGVREWSRKMGFASYNSIVTRTESLEKRRVGAFAWDLTGPSYLLPLKGEDSKPGFLVADVFADTVLDEFAIKYMIRKSQLLKASQKNLRFLPILIAEGFTGAALTKGRSEGLLLATPETLFGYAIARGLKNLLETLKNAAAIAAANPDRLLKLIEQLKDIEGAAGNLRGILFELIAAYIAKVQGGSIDIGITAKDKDSGKAADIDVLRIPNKGECIAIECKGKNPGGIVTLEEIEAWLKRLPIFLAYFKSERRFAEAKISFEIWTTGNFSEDALDLLKKERQKRTKHPIDWKNGNDVFAISKSAKEKTINKALREHFLVHPLAK